MKSINKITKTNNFHKILRLIAEESEGLYVSAPSTEEKAFYLGMTYTASILGLVYLGVPTPMSFDYNHAKEIFSEYLKETKPEPHQISIDEYLASLKKENNTDTDTDDSDDNTERLAKQIAKVLVKEFADSYKFKSKPTNKKGK